MKYEDTNKINKPVIRPCFPSSPRFPRAEGICLAGSSSWLKQFRWAVSTSFDKENLDEHHWKQIIIECESLLKESASILKLSRKFHHNPGPYVYHREEISLLFYLIFACIYILFVHKCSWNVILFVYNEQDRGRKNLNERISVASEVQDSEWAICSSLRCKRNFEIQWLKNRETYRAT